MDPRALPSTFHQMMKIPTSWGMQVIRGEQHASRNCYAVNLIIMLTIQEEPFKSIKKVELDPANLGRTTSVGEKLFEEEQARLTTLLRETRYNFSFQHSDMPGIDPTVISHHLQVDPKARSVKQKRCWFAPEQNVAIVEEVNNLLRFEFIREVKYLEWHANIIFVKKKNSKNRLCINFTDLNKACPKDPFPLALHWPTRRCHSWQQVFKLYGCIFGL